jgi:hypothetical protein
MHLILYSKPGCHLCEGLQEKLEQVQAPAIELEICDITSRDDWFQAYQYEVPVLVWQRPVDATDAKKTGQVEMISIPRPSPRASVQQLSRQLIQLYEQYAK